ncbi:hypothetical protein E4U59_007414, partial [Claviceps monticola]
MDSRQELLTYELFAKWLRQGVLAIPEATANSIASLVRTVWLPAEPHDVTPLRVADQARPTIDKQVTEARLNNGFEVVYVVDYKDL